MNSNDNFINACIMGWKQLIMKSLADPDIISELDLDSGLYMLFVNQDDELVDLLISHGASVDKCWELAVAHDDLQTAARIEAHPKYTGQCIYGVPAKANMSKYASKRGKKDPNDTPLDHLRNALKGNWDAVAKYNGNPMKPEELYNLIKLSEIHLIDMKHRGLYIPWLELFMQSGDERVTRYLIGAYCMTHKEIGLLWRCPIEVLRQFEERNPDWLPQRKNLPDYIADYILTSSDRSFSNIMYLLHVNNASTVPYEIFREPAVYRQVCLGLEWLNMQPVNIDQIVTAAIAYDDWKVLKTLRDSGHNLDQYVDFAKQVDSPMSIKFLTGQSLVSFE